MRSCLIVEGDPDVRRSLEALIRELDVRTIGVEDALDALAILEVHPIDLVLAEESLPGPTGTVLLRAVRAHWPQVTRVLIGSDLGSSVILRAVNQAGVHRVLLKQMHPLTLRDEVEGALNEGLLRRTTVIPADSRCRHVRVSAQRARPERSRRLQLVRPSQYAVNG